MQPHSMCGLALAMKVWSGTRDYSHLSKGNITVTYRNLYGEYKNNLYELSAISVTDKQIKAYVMRGGGGIACQLTLERNSTSEGAEVTQAHSQQHVSGLREVFKLEKKRITQGVHHNSALYGKFSAEVTHPDRLRLKLDSEMKNKSGQFVPISYELEIKSLS